ncbi:MAG: PQQ-binding-like beta-propeller repeat protein [Acidobacteriaceae bacterium]
MPKILALSTLIICATALGQTAVHPGEKVYQQHCAICHDSGAVRIPPRQVLQQQSIDAILKSLDSGIMKPQGATLTAAERADVAAWLGKASTVAAAPLANACSASASAPNGSWSSWGNGVANLRFQTTSAAGLSAADVPHLQLKWAFAVPDVTEARSQPAVIAGNLIFAGGTSVYALDARSGCTHWKTGLAAPVRSGVATGSPAGVPTAYVGDAGGNVYAIEIATGKILWQIHADTHPAAIVTGTPLYDRERLYVPVASYEELAAANPQYVCCTFRGSILALDANTGKVLWKTWTVPADPSPHFTRKGGKNVGPSGAGIWSAPTIDEEKGLLYVATGDNYSDPPTDLSDAVLALSLDTGKIVWSKQFRSGDAFNMGCDDPDSKTCPDADGPDYDFGASPILDQMPNGRRLLVLAQKSGTVYAVDPDAHGAPVWQAQLGKGGPLGGVEWGPATDGQQVYVTISDEGFLPSEKGMNLDPDKGGGMFALGLADGKQAWTAPPGKCDARRPCSPAEPGAVTVIPGAVFAGSLDGYIRAYATGTGKLLWDYDTEHSYQTVNGVAGHGGSLNAAGPVIVDGMVYVLSGYGNFGEAPGNVLLAFSVGGH